MQFCLRGANHRGADAMTAVLSLQLGDAVTLEREPENAYDPNAIKIFIGEIFAGYVGKEFAAELAPTMDYRGEKLPAFCVKQNGIFPEFDTDPAGKPVDDEGFATPSSALIDEDF